MAIIKDTMSGVSDSNGTEILKALGEKKNKYFIYHRFQSMGEKIKKVGGDNISSDRYETSHLVETEGRSAVDKNDRNWN